MPKSIKPRDSASGGASTSQGSAADPFATVASNAQGALELFTVTKDIPVHDDVPTPSYPPRTTRTTTVATRSGLMSRAIALTTLARDNFAFFRQNSFGTPTGLHSAERALNDLDDFLKHNGPSLTKLAERNIAMVGAELARIQEELHELQAALQVEKVPEAKAAIEGNLNLANLRTLRLRSLLSENQQIAAFLGQAGGRAARKR